MTRTPDKFIAMAVARISMTSPAKTFDAEYVYELAAGLQQAEENPTRVKCSVCPAMIVNPAPCLRSDCGFRK